MKILKSILDSNFFLFSHYEKRLTGKAYLNALAATLDYAARLIVGFVINPLLVISLGDYLYGAWQVLSRLSGYISAASGEPAQALKWTVAHQQASTDYQKKRRDVGSTLVVWVFFLPILTTIGGVFAWLTPTFLDSPVELSWIVRLTSALLIANLILMNLMTVPHSVLRGENLGYKRMGLSALLVFVGGGFTVIALYLNSGIVGVAAANLINTILTGVLFLHFVRLYVPWFGVAKPFLKEVRKFFGLSWWFLIWRLVMQLMRNGDIVVLGLVASVEMVPTYSLTKYVPATLTNIIALVVGAVTPGLGGIIGNDEFEKAARIRSEMMAITWLIATTLGSLILLWNRIFVQLWVGAEYYAGVIPTLLITIMVIQFVLIQNDARIIDLTLNLRHKVLLGFLSTAVSLILSIFFMKNLNLEIIGLCSGFIMGRLILSLSYPWLVGRFLQIPFSSQLRSTLRPTLTTLLFFILALSLGDLLTTSGWIELILFAGMTLLVVSVLAFYIGLSTKIRSILWQRFLRLIR